MTTQEATETTVITEFDQAALAKIQAVIKNSTNGHSLKLVGADGQEAELPASLSKALQGLVDYLAKGQAVNLSPVDKEVSLEEAALILDVSNYRMTKLLNLGEISFRAEGEKQLIQLKELLEYNQKWQAERERMLDEIVQISQEMGLYNLPPEAYK
jgi:hypothetical protein